MWQSKVGNIKTWGATGLWCNIGNSELACIMSFVVAGVVRSPVCHSYVLNNSKGRVPLALYVADAIQEPTLQPFNAGAAVR